MEEFSVTFLENLKNTTLLEWIAVVSGIIYVVLAASKNFACWIFAFVGSSIYIYLCYIGQLYIESALQFFYVVMAVYGFLTWQKSDAVSKKVVQWSLNSHLINIIISSFLTMFLGFIFDSYTNQANPYTDAFTTVFSLAATFMIAKGALHNWLYWIVIDAVSIYLYAERGYAMSALLMALYTVLAIFGWFSWRKHYKLQKA